MNKLFLFLIIAITTMALNGCSNGPESGGTWADQHERWGKSESQDPKGRF